MSPNEDEDDIDRPLTGGCIIIQAESQQCGS